MWPVFLFWVLTVLGSAVHLFGFPFAQVPNKFSDSCWPSFDGPGNPFVQLVDSKYGNSEPDGDP